MTDFWTGALVALGVLAGIPVAVAIVCWSLGLLLETTRGTVRVRLTPKQRDSRATLAAALFASRSIRLWVAGYGIVLYRQTGERWGGVSRLGAIHRAIIQADGEFTDD